MEWMDGTTQKYSIVINQVNLEWTLIYDFFMDCIIESIS